MKSQLVALVPLFALAAGTSHATPTSAPGSQVGACDNAVRAMGSDMGHRAEIGADGRSFQVYVVRANGTDYSVKCDVASGTIQDVGPRVSGDPQADSAAN